MSEDLIRRSDAIEVAYQLRHKPSDDEWDWWLRSFNAIPSTEQKRGEWVAVDSYSAFGGDESAWIAHGNPTAYHYCSNCKEQTYADEFGEEILSDFCPNCGARMEVEHD